MVNDDLRAALGTMIERYGFETVSRVLGEMEAGDTGSNEVAEDRRHGSRRGGRTKRRRSAVAYVQAMEVPLDRVAVVRRAAEEFERGEFLPTPGDVRSFCEAYGIEEPRSRSRVSGIPRIFKFLVTMDVADVKRMLDDRMFSGPATLAPIADAIRGKAREYRRMRYGG